MQRISQVGAMMETFGSLLTTMAQAVEEETTTVIRDEQATAAEQLSRTANEAGGKLADLHAANETLNTQLLRSNQQLKVAADKLAELETEVLPLAGINADDVFENLEELDLVVGKPSEVRAARDLIQKITRDLGPLLERCSCVPKKPAPKPKLANVADVVGKTVEAAVTNVVDAEPTKS